MPGEAADGAESTPVLRTLADKVNWLIDRAHPAGRGPYTNNEVADLIEKTTGEEISYTQIWKLRNGQAQNPQMRLIEAMAKTFGVPAAFFFPEFDEKQAGLLQEQVELLAMIRDARHRRRAAPRDPRAEPGSPQGDHRPHRRDRPRRSPATCVRR